MPTSVLPMASTRILRLAFGTALSLWISQAVGWTISYIAPIITLVLLAMPIPRPKPKFFVVVVLAMTLSIYGSFVFLPLLLHQKLVGLLLLCLALFHAFYVAAKGGPAVVSTLITIGLALTVAVGTVSVDALVTVAQGLVIGASVGAAVAIVSHAVMPDRELPEPPAEKVEQGKAIAPQVDLADARRNAFRSLAIVFPVLFWFLLSAASVSNLAVMIKVAAMAQEVSHIGTRKAAKSLIISTVVGGLAAIAGWQVLSMWPSLTMYVLLIALAGLLFGRRIFEGDGPAREADTWQFAYLTMIVVLAPAVMDSDFGSSADAAFYSRLMMFVWATLYAVVAVFVFDTLWPRRSDK